MLKKICVLFVAIFFIGCAHHTKNTVGGMHNDLASGLMVYHQYSLTTSHLNKQQKVVHSVTVFPADENVDLPSNTHALELAVAIVNPHKQQFEIWERINYSDLKTEKIFYKSEKLRYTSKRLSEEIIRIDLPIEYREHCQILYAVNVKDSTGEIIHHTYTARYKIGKQSN